jgi:hypothetical protein
MAALLALPIAGALLALSGLASAGAVAVVVLTAVLLMSASASGAFGLREGRGPAFAIAGSGVVALALTLAETAQLGGRPDLVDVVLPVLAVVFLFGAVAQLTRRGGRVDLVPSLALTVSCAAIAALGSLWIPLAYTPIGDAAAVVAGLAIAASGVVLLAGPWWDARDLPADPVIAAAVVVGAVAGLFALVLLDPGTVTWVQAVGIGFVASACAVIGRSWVLTVVDERAQALAASEAGDGPAPVDGPASADDHDATQALASGADAKPGGEATAVRTVSARHPDADQALIVATAIALLIAAGPVYVVARVLVG